MISWGIVALAFVLGCLLTYLQRSKKIAELSTELSSTKRTLEEDRLAKKQMANEVKSEFNSIAFEALSQATKEFIKLSSSSLENERGLAGKDLENKKSQIEKELKNMNTELEKVSKLVSELEKDRERKFGELTAQLTNSNEQTSLLLKTTNTLKEALANSRARGQWGERMAEDVLRLAGFVENTNYIKQKAISGVGSKPDFTFPLPKNLKLNMDVKFPFDNYVRFLNADNDAEREASKADFFRDIKAKLKEVTSRDYINPSQNTVDYVLLLVPNEQVFSFIQEADSTLFDNALKNKVICCSPITLFAVLAIIRQAIDNFSLEQTSNEILSLLGGFKLQWAKFLQKLEVVGKRIDDAQKEYQALTTTRRTQLERPLNKIESLRAQKGLPAEDPSALEMGEDETLPEPVPDTPQKVLSD